MDKVVFNAFNLFPDSMQLNLCKLDVMFIAWFSLKFQKVN